jgi:predicted NAD-dependent protein-ADP-ribosyltransferase YbiA (DUF1768 family)
MNNLILFYNPVDEYGCFSNFSNHSVRIYGRRWRTSEHAYQAMKFENFEKIFDLIVKASSPGKAAAIGRNPEYKIRADWELDISCVQVRIRNPKHSNFDINNATRDVLEKVKDLYMYEIVLAKFSQHPALSQVLLGTEEKHIIEDSARDSYWGWGAQKTGQNKLGKILMLVRNQLKHISLSDIISGTNLTQ